MTAVVKNMDRAMQDMNLERVRPRPSSPLAARHSPLGSIKPPTLNRIAFISHNR